MMNRVKNIGLVLFLIVLPVFLENCGFDIEESDRYFDWVKKGNTLTYNLRSTEYRVDKYSLLKIEESSGINDNMVFREETLPQKNDVPYFGPLLSVFSDVYRLDDGLHTATCSSCVSNPCISIQHYLKVPAKSGNIESIPEYSCAEKIYGYDVILRTDSIIEVPFGIFRTLVIHDTIKRNVKFWNEEAGLIRVDNYNRLQGDTLILELVETNY